MKSRTTKRFRDAFNKLPEHIQQQAKDAYQLFKKDPNHLSLRFKPVERLENVYSVRVSLSYRALGVKDSDEIVWFWIGSHSDYDRLIDNL
jgi:mRNA-degrading endonuclease RelE of RelBE toxin-antitoxin system